MNKATIGNEASMNVVTGSFWVLLRDHVLVCVTVSWRVVNP